jgi:xanthine dehydrogenase accessory factor
MSDRPPAPNPEIELDAARAAARWIAEDGRVAVATVVDTWGSAPVPVGGQLVIRGDGRFQGSVSGGCIEGDIIAEAEDVLATGAPRTMDFGVADETAWRAGLPCGGKISVFLERLEGEAGAGVVQRMLEARGQRKAMVVETDLATGARRWYERGAAAPAPIADRFRSGKSELVELDGKRAFLQAVLPSARAIVIGATHIAQVLTELMRLTGYQAIVVDPRSAFASQDRFAGVELRAEWPQDAIPAIGLDPYTAIVALAHVAHIDDEALKLALRADCLYIGALGSKRNHANRTKRLLEAGFTEAEIARVKCPIGLDIGAQTPPEIAVAVMAELISALRGPRNFRPADAPKR